MSKTTDKSEHDPMVDMFSDLFVWQLFSLREMAKLNFRIARLEGHSYESALRIATLPLYWPERALERMEKAIGVPVERFIENELRVLFPNGDE